MENGRFFNLKVNPFRKLHYIHDFESSIYFSIYDEKYFFQVIDLLPLLFDKIICNSDFLTKPEVVKYCSTERIKALCESQILLFLGDPEKEYDDPEEASLLEKWISDEMYFISEDEYSNPNDQYSKTEWDILEKWTEEDLNDKKFLRLLKQTRGQLHNNLFGINKDLPIDVDALFLNVVLKTSLYLSSPLFVHPQIKSILTHKFERMIKQSKATIPSLEYPEAFPCFLLALDHGFRDKALYLLYDCS